MPGNSCLNLCKMAKRVYPGCSGWYVFILNRRLNKRIVTSLLEVGTEQPSSRSDRCVVAVFPEQRQRNGGCFQSVERVHHGSPLFISAQSHNAPLEAARVAREAVHRP